MDSLVIEIGETNILARNANEDNFNDGKIHVTPGDNDSGESIEFGFKTGTQRIDLSPPIDKLSLNGDDIYVEREGSKYRNKNRNMVTVNYVDGKMKFGPVIKRDRDVVAISMCGFNDTIKLGDKGTYSDAIEELARDILETIKSYNDIDADKDDFTPIIKLQDTPYGPKKVMYGPKGKSICAIPMSIIPKDFERLNTISKGHMLFFIDREWCVDYS